MATYTPNMQIPLIDVDEKFAREGFNAALNTIDSVVTPLTHVSSRMHFSMWQPLTVYKTDDVVRTENNIPINSIWICTQAGTSGTTAPMSTSIGTIVTDGTCKWQLIQLIQKAITMHNDLQGRGESNAHPMSAITGLVDELKQFYWLTVPTYQDMLDLEDVRDGQRIFVVDATGDPTVGEGWALYVYSDITQTYTKIAEGESIDVVVDWNSVQNKPPNLTKRTCVFIGTQAVLIYPYNGKILEVTYAIQTRLPQTFNFKVQKQSEADFTANSNNWVDMITCAVPANTNFKKFEVTGELLLSPNDAIRILPSITINETTIQLVTDNV